MDSQKGEHELLSSVFKVVSKSFLCSDRDSLQHVLNIIDETDFPKRTRYSKALLNLKKAIKAGIQQGQYDALSLTEDQSEKVNVLLENERDAWGKVSEEFHKLGEEGLENLAKAWVHKCQVYLGEGKPKDVVRNAYYASRLFQESGEDEVAAILFADVLTREIFPRYLWEKYELIDLMSIPELVPRLFLFKWVEIDEERLQALVRQHVETLLEIVDSQDGMESMKAMEALRKIAGRTNEDQLSEATKTLLEKWKRKLDLRALMRRRITKTLSTLYALVGNCQKIEIISVISEALQDEDKNVRGVAIGFFNRYYSSLELRRQYYITRKALDLLNSSDLSLKEDGLSLLSGVDLSVLKLKEPKSDLFPEIERVADFTKTLLEEEISKTTDLIGTRFGILSSVFDNMGRFYESLQEEEQSLEFFTYSIKSSMRTLRYVDSLAYKVATSYAKKKRWKDLADFWYELYKIRLQKENYAGAVILLRNAFTSHLKAKQKTDALDTLQKILGIAEKQMETGQYWGAAISYKTAAEIYITLKRRDEALRLAWRIEEISDKAGILALKEIAEIYIACGMEKEASATLRKMLALTKNLQEVDIITSNITELLTDLLAWDLPPPTKIFLDDEEAIDINRPSNMFAYDYQVPEHFTEVYKANEKFCAMVRWLEKISNMMLELDNDKDALKIARQLVSMVERSSEFWNPSKWDQQFALNAADDIYRNSGEIKKAASCLEKAAKVLSDLGDWNLERMPSKEVFTSLYLDSREMQKARQIPDPTSNVRDYLVWIDEAEQAFDKICSRLGLQPPNVIHNFIDPSIWGAICYENAAFCLRKAADDYLSIGMNDKAFQCYETALHYNSMCHRESCISSEAEIASFFEKHSEASRLYNSLMEQAKKTNEYWKIKYYSGLSATEEGEALVLQGRRASATSYFSKGVKLLNDAKRLVRQEPMFLQVEVCAFRLKYSKARLKIEQGFIEREEKGDYKRAIRRFREAESLFKRLIRSELTKQEGTLLKGYEMFARAHIIFTESILLQKQQKLAESNLAIYDAISIFSDLCDLFRQTMRKQSSEWISGVLSCLNAILEWQQGGSETRVLSFFENARLSLSKVIGEEPVRKMSNRKVSAKLLGGMAFPLPAPMCHAYDLMEETIRLDVFGEIPSEVTEGEVIHVKVIVRIEKTEMGMPESLPLRLVIEQSGKRVIYPGESGTFVSTNRYLMRHPSLLFDRSGEDVIRIGVEYVGRGCFIPLNRLTKRYRVKVKPHVPVLEPQDVRKMLSDIRELSLSNQEYLQKLSRNVLQSSKLIKEIDSALNNDLPNLRKDIRKWMTMVEESQLLSKEERETFLRELGKILKLSSTAKVMLTIPLIPGFAQYRRELKIDTDWNKWLEKLGSIFRRR